jgi:hypothetical protein
VIKNNLPQLSFMVLVLFLASCATPITQSELIPQEQVMFQSTNKSVVVLPIIIGERPKPGWTDPAAVPFPSADEYRFAMVNTLSQSGLFTEVMTEGPADYSLSAEVIGERMSGGMNNIVLILVRYTLTDTESQNAVWIENVLSHFEMSAEEVFMGADRVAKTFEGAVRNNMDQIDDCLARALAVRRM